VGVLANQALNFLATGESPTRLGNRHPNIAPYETLPASDDRFIIGVGSDAQFRRFCHILGLDDLANEERYASNAARVANRCSLTERISAATAAWQRGALLAELEKANVPAGPINTVAEAFADPQVRARAMQITMSREADGKPLPGVRTPLQFSDANLAQVTPPPTLGHGKLDWR